MIIVFLSRLMLIVTNISIICTFFLQLKWQSKCSPHFLLYSEPLIISLKKGFIYKYIWEYLCNKCSDNWEWSLPLLSFNIKSFLEGFSASNTKIMFRFFCFVNQQHQPQMLDNAGCACNLVCFDSCKQGSYIMSPTWI